MLGLTNNVCVQAGSCFEANDIMTTIKVAVSQVPDSWRFE